MRANVPADAIPIVCDTVSKDPWVRRLIKGSYNLRPVKPKYDQIYDLDPVLHLIESLYPLEKLSLVDLTLRLAILLAVVTAHRKQTLALKLDNIIKTRTDFEIRIPKTIKTSRAGVCQPLLLQPQFDDRPELCAARTLERYFEVTQELRGEIRSLFITTTKPIKPASKDIISRWLRTCLQNAGIDKGFTSHSIRHASTSAAFKKGVNVSIIKNLAGWSERSTVFDRFYYRPIIHNKHEFARAVLSL